MKPGDRVTQIYQRPFNYQVRIPAPQTEAQAQQHVEGLPAEIANELDVVTLEVVEVRPAMDTERCPPPMFHEELDLDRDAPWGAADVDG